GLVSSRPLSLLHGCPVAFPLLSLGTGCSGQPGAFIPFASGPRGCVGQPFARLALQVLLARLCRDHDFRQPEELLPPPGRGEGQGVRSVGKGMLKEMQAGFTVLPLGGVRLR
ncbi:unnamed protein product, partial [Discosporangium mesarthrocarpum]